jgi:CHASE2 domain-containing sensor protein
MSKRAILRLDGKLEEGFRVTLEVGEEGNLHFAEQDGYLEANPELIECLEQWRTNYRGLSQVNRIKVNAIVVQKASPKEVEICRESGRSLQHLFTTWLSSKSFRVIDTQLREAVDRKDWIRVVIRTQDRRLHLLPWHIWEFIDRYQAEVAFSLPSRQMEYHPSRKLGERVRILAILGHQAGIDVETDRALLQALPRADVKFLVEPDRQTLTQQLWEQDWDVLFFAGHSQTKDDSGVIHINPGDSLGIEDLKFGMRRAIAHGLQLAIFNSCDGLGLVYQVEQLGLPQIVVMRQPVPDPVAQAFLKNLLTAFVGGKRFYLAVREAREQLQGFEHRYPCASWLPIIFQNLNQPPLLWEDLCQPVKTEEDKLESVATPRKKLKLRGMLLISLVIAGLVCGTRALGVLQLIELKAFDHLLQMRPPESEDPHILVIGADEKDLRTYGHPLPDEILVKLLKKVNQLKPAAIGLDIARDQPVPKQGSKAYEALGQQFNQNKNLITPCKFDEGTENSIAPPPKSPKMQVGFVNSYKDVTQTGKQDNTTRRYLLSRSKNAVSAPSACETNYSFGLLLVDQYLSARNIPVKVEGQDWKLGSVLTQHLKARSGGYQNLDAAGNQVLINYRNTADPQRIAQQVTVRDVLTESDRFDPGWVKDRIVLIGVVAPSVPDPHFTPYGEIRGLYLQAHAISQLRAAVEDNRLLLNCWDQWGDVLWIVFWTSTATVMVSLCKRSLNRNLMIGGLIVLIYSVSWGGLTFFGIWLPLVPTIAAVSIVWIATAGYMALLRSKSFQESL